jgi:DNA-binding response OmpR family regulator
MTMIDSASGESTQPRRVLLVDDSVDATEAMSMLLETPGHAVSVMHDGPSAVAMVHDFAPEVVVVDIGLPGMDGFEVAREMHARRD